MCKFILKILVEIYILGFLWNLFDGFYNYDELKQQLNFHSEWDVCVWAATWPDRIIKMIGSWSDESLLSYELNDDDIEKEVSQGKRTAIKQMPDLEMLQQQCEADDAESCAELGIAYEKEDTIRNIEKAVEYSVKACELNNGKGCNNIGFMLSKYANGDVKELLQALTFFQKACDLDYGSGCANIGNMYYNGEGVIKDYFQAFKFYQKACSLNHGSGCGNLGVLYAAGQGISQDVLKAGKLYQKACDLKDRVGCYNLAHIYYAGQGVTKNYSKAIKLFEKSCELNNGAACNNLGYMYGNGQGVSKNTSKAFKLYKKACDLDEKDGCKNVRMFGE